MDLRTSPDDEAFRAGLREFLAEQLPTIPPQPGRDDWPARRKWDTDWQRRLFDAGYAGLNWPKEYGGQEASPTQQLIFLEETTKARAPYVGVNFVGLLHAGPTIVAEGSAEQKAEHLPKILRGDEVWCQGFSEPGSGSDLASLRTRAVRDGDHYVVTGQKIWCSYGQIGRVGAENDGWRVTNVTLSFERGTAFVSDLVDTTRLVEELAPYMMDPGQRRELGHIAAELDALWALTKRNVTQAASGRQGRGPYMIKFAYSEVCQKLGELALRVLARDIATVDGEGPFVEERLRSLAFTIAAGTSQIQKNIIGERVLGLPREPR